MQEHESRKAYPESVVKWGESGSFSLCLRPDRPSAVDIRTTQIELEDDCPDALLTRDLILPFFHCDPQSVYEHITQQCTIRPDRHTGLSSKLDKRNFYRDVASIFAHVIIGHANLRLDVEGVERGGENGTSVYLKLGRTASFDYFAEKAQRLLDYSLTQRSKVSDCDIEFMKEDPVIGRLFESPDPKVLIATSVDPTAELQPDFIPETLRFDEIGDGSSALHGSNRRTWYMTRL